MRNRYYTPATGRFLTEDPIRSGLNWYAYCGNSPIKFIDPLGLSEVALRSYAESRGAYVHYWDSEKTIVIYNGIRHDFTPKNSNMKNGTLYADDALLNSLFGWGKSSNYGAARPYGQTYGSGSSNYNDPRNCYTYATDLDGYGNPGDVSGQKVIYNGSSAPTTAQISSAIMDDLKTFNRTARVIDDYDSDIEDNEYRIAFRVGSKPMTDKNGYEYGYDYHFMLQHDDGTWSEKRSQYGDSILHMDGNPTTLDWHLYWSDGSTSLNYYDSGTVFMAISAK